MHGMPISSVAPLGTTSTGPLSLIIAAVPLLEVVDWVVVDLEVEVDVVAFVLTETRLALVVMVSDEPFRFNVVELEAEVVLPFFLCWRPSRVGANSRFPLYFMPCTSFTSSLLVFCIAFPPEDATRRALDPGFIDAVDVGRVDDKDVALPGPVLSLLAAASRLADAGTSTTVTVVLMLALLLTDPVDIFRGRGVAMPRFDPLSRFSRALEVDVADGVRGRSETVDELAV